MTPNTPLSIYLHARCLRCQARAWLCHNDPHAVAAHCLFHLNRHARLAPRSWTAHTIYQLKNHATRILYETGHCTQVTIHTQTLTCWECDGTGRDDWHDGETCWKCDGTGIYRQHHLYCFRFTIAGRRYTWHQPRNLVTWPVKLAFLPFTEYTPIPRHADTDLFAEASLLAEPRYLRELYVITLHQYLLMHHVPYLDLPRLGPRTLYETMHLTWLQSRFHHWLWRTRLKISHLPARFFYWRQRLRGLLEYLDTGQLPAQVGEREGGSHLDFEEDTLPF